MPASWRSLQADRAAIVARPGARKCRESETPSNGGAASLRLVRKQTGSAGVSRGSGWPLRWRLRCGSLEDLLQGAQVGGLDQVLIEADGSSALAVFGLSVTRQRHQPDPARTDALA